MISKQLSREANWATHILKSHFTQRELVRHTICYHCSDKSIKCSLFDTDGQKRLSQFTHQVIMVVSFHHSPKQKVQLSVLSDIMIICTNIVIKNTWKAIGQSRDKDKNSQKRLSQFIDQVVNNVLSSYYLALDCTCNQVKVSFSGWSEKIKPIKQSGNHKTIFSSFPITKSESYSTRVKPNSFD